MCHCLQTGRKFCSRCAVYIQKGTVRNPLSSWGKATHGTFEAKRVVHLWRTDWMRRAGLQLEIMPGGCRPTCDSWQSSNTTLEA